MIACLLHCATNSNYNGLLGRKICSKAVEIICFKADHAKAFETNRSHLTLLLCLLIGKGKHRLNCMII